MCARTRIRTRCIVALGRMRPFQNAQDVTTTDELVMPVESVRSQHRLETDEPLLAGVEVCLVFEFSLSHYNRILQEIEALQSAGASVRLLTSFRESEPVPAGVARSVIPLANLDGPSGRADSTAQSRWVRLIDNALRSVAIPIANRMKSLRNTRNRLAAIKRLCRTVDIFWVIDYPSLPTVLRGTRDTAARVVYESVDLVPEYVYRGEVFRRRSLAGERRRIGEVDGFITACDSYADYYVRTYEGVLKRRPVVRDNMPKKLVQKPGATSRPLRLIFLGSLMPDRPVLELIRAMAIVSADVSLAFQGKNYLGSRPSALIEELGIGDRVRILEPCAPDDVVDEASAYDVGIVALRGADENERWASTAKLFTYMSAGLAVLGSDLPGIARVVGAAQNGALVAGTDPKQWADAIDSIASLPDQTIDAMRLRSLESAKPLAWSRQRSAFVAEFIRALDQPQGTRRPIWHKP